MAVWKKCIIFQKSLKMTKNEKYKMIELSFFTPRAESPEGYCYHGFGRRASAGRAGGRRACRFQSYRTFSFNFLATILKFLMDVPHHKAHP